MNNALDFASACAWLKQDIELRLAEDFRRDRKIHPFALVWATVAPGSEQPFDEPHPLVMPPPIVVEGQLTRDERHRIYAGCIRKLALASQARAVAFVSMIELHAKKCVLVLLEHRDGTLTRCAPIDSGSLGAFEDLVLPKGHSFEGCYRDFLPERWMH